MIYLTKVEEKHGPIFFANKIPNDLDKYRRSMKSSDSNILDKGVLQFTPVIGSARTLTMFDTNIPHYAGLVEKGYERQILRFDFEDESWNA